LSSVTRAVVMLRSAAELLVCAAEQRVELDLRLLALHGGIATHAINRGRLVHGGLRIVQALERFRISGELREQRGPEVGCGGPLACGCGAASLVAQAGSARADHRRALALTRICWGGSRRRWRRGWRGWSRRRRRRRRRIIWPRLGGRTLLRRGERCR
jgi:hypothetical protein